MCALPAIKDYQSRLQEQNASARALFTRTNCAPTHCIASYRPNKQVGKSKSVLLVRQHAVKRENQWASNMVAKWCTDQGHPHLISRLVTFWRRLMNLCEMNGDRANNLPSAMPTSMTWAFVGRRGSRSRSDTTRRKLAEQYIRHLIAIGLVRRVCKGGILAVQAYQKMRPVRHTNLPSGCGSNWLFRRISSTSFAGCVSKNITATPGVAAAPRPVAQSRQQCAAEKKRDRHGKFIKRLLGAAPGADASESAASGSSNGVNTVQQTLCDVLVFPKKNNQDSQHQQLQPSSPETASPSDSRPTGDEDCTAAAPKPADAHNWQIDGRKPCTSPEAQAMMRMVMGVAAIAPKNAEVDAVEPPRPKPKAGVAVAPETPVAPNPVDAAPDVGPNDTCTLSPARLAKGEWPLTRDMVAELNEAYGLNVNFDLLTRRNLSFNDFGEAIIYAKHAVIDGKKFRSMERIVVHSAIKRSKGLWGGLKQSRS